jgi:hypothetical protein
MTFPRWEVIDTMVFGGLRDQMEEALQARDGDEWRRLFDIYRRTIELLEKKDPHLASLSIQHFRIRQDLNSPPTRQ